MTSDFFQIGEIIWFNDIGEIIWVYSLSYSEIAGFILIWILAYQSNYIITCDDLPKATMDILMKNNRQ